MKKKETRVLKLNRETLRTLDEHTLDHAHGGQTGSICSGYTDVSCPTIKRCPTDLC
jgi:hypothetical protein